MHHANTPAAPFEFSAPLRSSRHRIHHACNKPLITQSHLHCIKIDNLFIHNFDLNDLSYLGPMKPYLGKAWQNCAPDQRKQHHSGAIAVWPTSAQPEVKVSIMAIAHQARR